MPASPSRRTPRASRSMVDLLKAVGESGHLIGYWEVSRQPRGVLLRAASRQTYATSEAASDAGCVLLELFAGPDYDFLGEPIVRARSQATPRGEIWRAWVEVQLRRVPQSAGVPVGG